MRHMEKKSIAERIESKIEHTESGCWRWTASRRGRFDDGQLAVMGADGKLKMLSVRRYLYSQQKELARRQWLMRVCETPLCVNPAHAELAPRKGTEFPERLERIVRERERGATLQEIGDLFSLTKERIRQILRRVGLVSGNRLKPRYRHGDDVVDKLILENRHLRALLREKEIDQPETVVFSPEA